MKTLEEVMANLGVLQYECGKALKRLYIQVPETIAKDVSKTIFAYTNELELHNQYVLKLVKFVEAQKCECHKINNNLGGFKKCPRCALLEEVLSSKSLECQRKLPDPTPEQAKCQHEKWRAMLPQPRHCVECGLLMWDAGD